MLPGTVIACTGSRGDVPAWLAEVGVEAPEEEHQTKLIYLTRWYRLPDGHELDLNGRLFGDLGYIRCLVVPGDGGALSATLAVIGRVMIRLFNLLTLPQGLFTDAEFVGRVGPLLAKPPQAPPAPEGPTLAELLA